MLFIVFLASGACAGLAYYYSAYAQNIAAAKLAFTLSLVLVVGTFGMRKYRAEQAACAEYIARLETMVLQYQAAQEPMYYGGPGVWLDINNLDTYRIDLDTYRIDSRPDSGFVGVMY